jgi:hypothetical protein
MLIADNEEEVNKLNSKSNIIILKDRMSNVASFYGPYVSRAIRLFDSCSDFERNGLKSFDSLNLVKYSAKEVSRQAASAVQIASFKFEDLS